MTTFKAALRSALTEAVGIPQTARGGSVTPHKARGGSIARVSGGELVELLAPPVAVVCPKCGADCGTPRLATRRRRLVQVVAGGRVLSVEIEA